MSEDGLIVGNYLYDMIAYCTSIVARREDGTVIHGRNMDFFFEEYLRKLTYTARFVKNGELLYYSTHFASQTGVYTGFKPHAFSISINFRRT